MQVNGSFRKGVLYTNNKIKFSLAFKGIIYHKKISFFLLKSQ